MPEQLRLVVFDRDPRVLAHTGDLHTSRSAAAANRLLRATHRHAVLAVYNEAKWLTDDDAAARTGLDLAEARRRCSDLRNEGLIAPARRDDGMIQTSFLASGRQGMLCSITREGVARLALAEGDWSS